MTVTTTLAELMDFSWFMPSPKEMKKMQKQLDATKKKREQELDNRIKKIVKEMKVKIH